MEILIFLAGFVLGAISVFVVFTMLQRKAEDAKEELISRMQLQFENLTNKIFKESSQEFSEQNKVKLEEFFLKFRERIEDFEKRTELNFKTEAEKLIQFDLNIKNFIEAGNKISQDTTSLATMMKGDNRRQGSWGEIVLERVLEASGLREGEEYELQKGIADGRPDATINLPENKKVYIDAKTSLSSWEAYVNAQEEHEKEEKLKEFLESTKAHITGLSKRPYTASENSPDYVLMFIPIESCYSLLFCQDSKLWDLAWKNNVMPVSPSTLLAALKIINNFYKIEKQNKNALEISKICTKMLDKFADMLKDVLDARKKIASAVIRLNGHDSIIRNIERLQELGITINKQIPEIDEKIMEETTNL